jgi:MATE family multidrug resistance protein
MTLAWNHENAGPVRRPMHRGAERRQALAEFMSLLRTASPIVAVGFMNLAISLTDMAMMAAYDRNALAAGAIVGDIFSIAIQFAAGALSALVAPVAAARAVGAEREIGRVVGAGLRIAAILAILGFCLIASITDILEFAGVVLPLTDTAETYARFMAAAFALMTVVALSRSVLPALGRGTFAFWVIAAAVPLNAVANAIFMYGYCGMPAMGLAGAGAASLLVAAFAATALLADMLLAPAMRPFAIWHGIVHAGRFVPLPLLRTAFMTGAVALCETGIFLSSTAFVGFIAVANVPAHVAVFRSLAITYVIATGFGHAVTIRLAEANAKSDARRQHMVRRAAVLGVPALGSLFLVFIFAAPQVVAQLMAVEPALADGIAAIAPFAAVSGAAIVPAVVAFGMLRATSNVSRPTLIGLVGYWGIGAPAMAALAGPMGLGVVGIWIGLAAGTVATAVGSWAYARTTLPGSGLDRGVTG